MSGLFLCRLLLLNVFCTPLPWVNAVYVPLVQSDPVLLLTPSLKSCKGSGTSPIRALDIGFQGAVDHFEPLPEYTPPAVGQSLIPQAPTPASASQVLGRRLHQVHEGLMHMQRCRELFAAAMRGVDHLVYDPEGDRLLLRGEEVTVESSSSEEGSGESEGNEEGTE